MFLTKRKDNPNPNPNPNPFVKLIFSNVFFLFIFFKGTIKATGEGKGKLMVVLYMILFYLQGSLYSKSTKWTRQTAQFSAESIRTRLYSCPIPPNGNCGRRRRVNFGKTQTFHSLIICNLYFGISLFSE